MPKQKKSTNQTAKQQEKTVNIVELARHYSESCCSLDYKEMLVIEAHYSDFELEA